MKLSPAALETNDANDTRIGRDEVPPLRQPSTANAKNTQQASHSMHTGGVNVRLADGSVRFIGDFIDKGANGTPPQCLEVWDKLKLSNDGETIQPGQF
jgi:hypothetical protein